MVIALALLVAFATESAAATSKVHVAYWEKWRGAEEDAMRAVIDTFNASQDRIVVDYLPTSQLDRKAILAIAGGDPPDMIGLFPPFLTSFIEAEALMPLDEFMRRDSGTPEAWLARYYPVYAKLCQHKGRTYGAISTAAMIVLHWNKTLFREAGLDPDRPPQTLAELDDYARRLTRRDPKTGALRQMGFLPQEPDWYPWAYSLWFGGQLFDGREITLATDPHNLDAMRWVARYTRENGGGDAITKFVSGFGPFASSENGFFSGKVAMVFQGVWLNNFIRQFKPGLDYGVTAGWPSVVPGVNDFAWAEADVLAIPRGARHPEEAWEFIRYVNSVNLNAQSRQELQGSELLAFLQVKNSPMREWSPFFSNHHPHPHIGVFRQAASSPHAAGAPAMGIWPEYRREFSSAFSLVRLLLASPEEAFGYAQNRLDESWKYYRRSLERHGQLTNPTPDFP